MQFQFQSIQCPLLASVGSACKWYTVMHSGEHPCTYQISLTSSPRMNIVTEVAHNCETTYLLEGQERCPTEVSNEEELPTERRSYPLRGEVTL